MAKSKKPNIDLENDQFSPKIKPLGKSKKTNTPPTQFKNNTTEEELPDPVIFAMDALIDGNTEQRTIEMLKKTYGLNNRTYCSDILNKARKEFSTRDNKDKDYYRSKFEDMYLSIYKQAFKAGHFKTCTDIIDNLSKIHNLYESDTKDKFVANITYIKDGDNK